MSTSNRGAFIVLEGLDRSGKSSQAFKIVEYLNGKAELIGFPNRTTALGKVIDDYLTKKVAIKDPHSSHLLFSANRWELKSEIERKLNSGITLICDRYSYSGAAYSAALGLEQEWCWSCEKGLPVPDTVFFLTVTPEVAKQRGGYGEEVYEKVEFQAKVKEQFDKNDNLKNWCKIDASKSKEEVFDTIIVQVDETIKNVANTKLNYF